MRVGTRHRGGPERTSRLALPPVQGKHVDASSSYSAGAKFSQGQSRLDARHPFAGRPRPGPARPRTNRPLAEPIGASDRVGSDEGVHDVTVATPFHGISLEEVQALDVRRLGE
jgi:hypothetical protein